MFWRHTVGLLVGVVVVAPACTEKKAAPAPVVEEEPPPPPPPSRADPREPERVDAELRAGVVSTCLDGRDSEARAALCACAADAFMRDTRVEELREIKRDGWNRDTLALLELARRACKETK